jgi:hypothetical protein
LFAEWGADRYFKSSFAGLGSAMLLMREFGRIGELFARKLGKTALANEARGDPSADRPGSSSLVMAASTKLDPALSQAIVAHHLRLFGVRGRSVRVLGRAEAGDVALAREVLDRGEAVIALDPDMEFCSGFGVSLKVVGSVPQVVSAVLAGDRPWKRLRTLHPACAFAHPLGIPIVTMGAADSVAWLWVPSGSCGILFVGTALAADLMRYRQGDPFQAFAPETSPKWGIAGERPLYLFETQLEGEAPGERHADWWAMTLVEGLKQHAKLEPESVLPNGAPGAIVVTGDDDQASLANYDLQLGEMGELPITYFLHPKTKHDRASMARLFANRRVDLGLHPDALDAPERYDELFAEQTQWYRELCGASPLSVRNHGFLNRGYWGHLPAWLAGGMRLSSNLPGLDGRVLNGSLLPGRMAWEGKLTSHWSVLTAIGDGMVFALGMSPEEAGQRILDLAENIRASGVPGVIVLNLHPENIAKTVEMHRAAREVARSGFIPWTVRECIEWFDAGEPPCSTSP